MVKKKYLVVYISMKMTTTKNRSIWWAKKDSDQIRTFGLLYKYTVCLSSMHENLFFTSFFVIAISSNIAITSSR